MKKDHKDALDHLEEWQRNKDVPGHFTGGNIPHWLHNPGKRINLGIALLIGGLFYTGMFIFELATNQNGEEVMGAILILIPGVVALLAGIKLLRKK